MADKLPEMGLTSLDRNKILKDIAYFSIVPLSFYIGQVILEINAPGHILKITDFIPSNATSIAIVTWVFNQILNAVRKYTT